MVKIPTEDLSYNFPSLPVVQLQSRDILKVAHSAADSSNALFHLGHPALDNIMMRTDIGGGAWSAFSNGLEICEALASIVDPTGDPSYCEPSADAAVHTTILEMVREISESSHLEFVVNDARAELEQALPNFYNVFLEIAQRYGLREDRDARFYRVGAAGVLWAMQTRLDTMLAVA